MTPAANCPRCAWVKDQVVTIDNGKVTGCKVITESDVRPERMSAVLPVGQADIALYGPAGE